MNLIVFIDVTSFKAWRRVLRNDYYSDESWMFEEFLQRTIPMDKNSFLIMKNLILYTHDSRYLVFINVFSNSCNSIGSCDGFDTDLHDFETKISFENRRIKINDRSYTDRELQSRYGGKIIENYFRDGIRLEIQWFIIHFFLDQNWTDIRSESNYYRCVKILIHDTQKKRGVCHNQLILIFTRYERKKRTDIQ